MNSPLICMTLTGKTLEEDKQLVNRYFKYIDLVELRVDYLREEEQLYARKFPAMVHLPSILTIRRDVDGGLFSGSEFSRTCLFSRALAFADQDKAKNFAYVDFEDDFHIPSLQDAAMAFGVKIIRSLHSMKEPIYNLKDRCMEMRKTGYEIPKIAFQPKKLSDVANLFREGSQMTELEHIFCAMGPEGLPSRILAAYTNSYLTYTSPDELISNTNGIGHTDPITLSNLYNFRSITRKTRLFGITGWPLYKISGPEIHNSGFKKAGIDAVYIPIRSQLVSEALSFAEQIGIEGLSITNPHKESVMYYLNEQTPEVIQIGACNTAIYKNKKWYGYNTNAYGFKRALEEFLGPIKIKRKKVAIIGAGGAAKAVAYILKQMGARVCIFNRSLNHAKQLAERYGFEYCSLEPECAPILDEYSNLIVQTTSVGGSRETKNDNQNQPEQNDPIYFYNFRGNEILFDILYRPAITPVMKRASLAGCRVSNGYKMLEYQAYAQFKLFTGQDFEEGSEEINFN